MLLKAAGRVGEALLLVMAAIVVIGSQAGLAAPVVREHCLDADALETASGTVVDTKWTYLAWPPLYLAPIDPPGRCVRNSLTREALNRLGVWKLPEPEEQVRRHLAEQVAGATAGDESREGKSGVSDALVEEFGQKSTLQQVAANRIRVVFARAARPFGASKGAERAIKLVFSGRLEAVSIGELDRAIAEYDAAPDRSTDSLRRLQVASREVERTRIAAGRFAREAVGVRRLIRVWNREVERSTHFTRRLAAFVERGRRVSARIRAFLRTAREARRSGRLAEYRRDGGAVAKAVGELVRESDGIQQEQGRIQTALRGHFVADEAVQELLRRVGERYPESPLAE